MLSSEPVELVTPSPAQVKRKKIGHSAFWLVRFSWNLVYVVIQTAENVQVKSPRHSNSTPYKITKWLQLRIQFRARKFVWKQRWEVRAVFCPLGCGRTCCYCYPIWYVSPTVMRCVSSSSIHPDIYRQWLSSDRQTPWDTQEYSGTFATSSRKISYWPL